MGFFFFRASFLHPIIDTDTMQLRCYLEWKQVYDYNSEYT